MYNKDNNSNSANSPSFYYNGGGPVSLNGAGSEYVDSNSIPMRPLMLSPTGGGANNSGNNGTTSPNYGVATRGGGSYLLQPPGELTIEKFIYQQLNSNMKFETMILLPLVTKYKIKKKVK